MWTRGGEYLRAQIWKTPDKVAPLANLGIFELFFETDVEDRFDQNMNIGYNNIGLKLHACPFGKKNFWL